jgi:sulfoquinovosidase
MQIETESGGFTLKLAGKTLIRHTPDAPFLFVGIGEPRVDMHMGFFDIEDYIIEREALRHVRLTQAGTASQLKCSVDASGPPVVSIVITGDADRAALAFAATDPRVNRVWIRLLAEPGEHVWGGGEQFSYLDLRGRRFPLWVSEPGVGRDRTTFVSWQADRDGGHGGDWWMTYCPQPSFISSRRYGVHLDTTAYAAFDFRQATLHELEAWAVPGALELYAATDFAGLVAALSDRFGRPPPLPEWTDTGAIIGLKDGARSFERLDGIIEAGVHVAGLWCEDWAGIRQTALGRRLFWNWEWDPARYPDLPRRINELAERNIRFLAYANPYLNTEGPLFTEAEVGGHFIRNRAGDTYRVDFGGFNGGMVDLTNPDAAHWFIDRILKQNMLDMGVAGWMADFGEFVPADAVLHAGDPMLLHNAWPVLWAEVNARAVAEAGRSGDVLFFMRSGFAGAQHYCPLLWGGDQSVDFSRHDGLPSAICAALSSGLVGHPYHHTDVGGFMSLYGNRRTPEVMMRWVEMAAFTTVMRTHEGNRPEDNLQIDSSPALLSHFARMTRLFRAMAPYRRAVVAEASTRGVPMQRALFLGFPDDPAGYKVQHEFLLGPDLLVVPVVAEGARSWRVYLPAGADWTHLWSGATHRGGQEVTVAAPLGETPLFFREGSAFSALFRKLVEIAGD